MNSKATVVLSPDDRHLVRIASSTEHVGLSMSAASSYSLSMTASASISTSQSGSMNRDTCTIVFAGRIEAKNSPCTEATACQSSILVSRVRVRTTCSSDASARSNASLMISRQRLACAAASPFPTVRPSGPSGAVPDTATIGPTRTAREIPTRGSYGLPLEINRLTSALPLRCPSCRPNDSRGAAALTIAAAPTAPAVGRRTSIGCGWSPGRITPPG